jgi:hypothetical protein
VAAARPFRCVFVVCPSYNPVGPLDVAGGYDQGSDRFVTPGELVDRGYQDAYRQFIDPVVGASGERLEMSGHRRAWGAVASSEAAMRAAPTEGPSSGRPS